MEAASGIARIAGSMGRWRLWRPGRIIPGAAEEKRVWMQGIDDIMGSALDRMLADHLSEDSVRRARGGEWLDQAWLAVADLGLPLMLLDEQQGGFGLDPHDAIGLIRLLGTYVVPLPVAETAIANRALARAGLPLADGPASFVPATRCLRASGGQLTGMAPRVPWGADVTTLAIEVDDEGGTRRLLRLNRAEWTIAENGMNVARAPRPSLALDVSLTNASPFAGDLMLEGAAIRTLLMAGALEKILALTLSHVSEREQFGRPLSKFQVVQHELAKIAAEVAAATAAAEIAIDALAEPGRDGTMAIAASRIRCGDAASTVLGIAHQMHGAIGTAERTPPPSLHDGGMGMARRVRKSPLMGVQGRRHHPVRRVCGLLAAYHFNLMESQCALARRLLKYSTALRCCARRCAPSLQTNWQLSVQSSGRRVGRASTPHSPAGSRSAVGWA